MGTGPGDYEERMKDAALKLQALLDPTIEDEASRVQKGLMLYRQSQVYQMVIEEDGISASVQDVTPVRVFIDLDEMEHSGCTCPAEGICRHQVAVFFAAYSKKSSVGDWLDQWRKPLKEQNIASMLGLQRAKDLIKTNGTLAPDYDRWVASFEESFDFILKSKTHVNPYIVPELYQVYIRKIRVDAPIEQEWRMLYDLISTVVSFRKLAELSEEMGHTEDMAQRYYGHLFQRGLEEAEIHIRRLGVQTLPFAFDNFLPRLKDDAFSLLTACRTLPYERIYLYRLLWTKLFKNRPWREEESARIRDFLQEQEDGGDTTALLISQIHINVLLQEDELAISVADSIENKTIVPYLPYWIDLLTEQKEWTRVALYIDLLMAKIKAYFSVLHSYAASEFTRIALRSIAPYFKENGRTDMYEKALVQTLPYSYREYEYFLFDQQQYEKWGELNAFIGFQLSEMPKDRLKVVEKEQPQVVLALYHQSVQSHLDMKNRQSYKAAVRHLKKLRTLYKKLKQQDEWQVFFDRLLEKTKRLRAFHEECRRSKLIDA
ncbi:hypothetical protein SAMN04488577_3230 [Bacillus sp. cl95]|nr:hypothetical protein SAMN02799634_104284 [Bacillus sp. UNCCL13]SFQ88524.1 hypothetical protein SAMN04488577_3230 [Bacillus sp. cl95]